jgi:nucleoside-diphosphate-sugar epimerase
MLHGNPACTINVLGATGQAGMPLASALTGSRVHALSALQGADGDIACGLIDRRSDRLFPLAGLRLDLP